MLNPTSVGQSPTFGSWTPKLKQMGVHETGSTSARPSVALCCLSLQPCVKMLSCRQKMMMIMRQPLLANAQRLSECWLKCPTREELTAGNDLERWLLGLNEVLANTHLSPSVRREVENAIRKYRH